MKKHFATSIKKYNVYSVDIFIGQGIVRISNAELVS